MTKSEFEACFQAVATDHGRYLLAVGWVAHAGLTPVLESVGQNDDFRFVVKESPDPAPQVVTSFCICAEIVGDPRSVMVDVGGKPVQVHVHGVDWTCPEDGPRIWVK